MKGKNKLIRKNKSKFMAIYNVRKKTVTRKSYCRVVISVSDGCVAFR